MDTLFETYLHGGLKFYIFLIFTLYPCKDGIDPLLSAVEKRHVEVVRMLLEAGASPNNAHSKDDMWCLKQARENYHDEMVELLLKYGAREPKTLLEKCVIA